MTLRSLPLTLLALGLISIQVNCGALPDSKVSAPPSAPPPPPSKYGDTSSGFAQPPSTTAGTVPAPPPPATTFPFPMPTAGGLLPGSDGQKPTTMMGALMLFEQEAMRLDASAANCDLACRALGSLERAARVVCDLDQEADHPRCEMARTRLRAARTRVRAACGQCSGGTTTDPDAPMSP